MLLLLSLPLLGNNNKRPESSNDRLCSGVLKGVLGADEQPQHILM